ncbi:MAG TPA: lyase family protein, partial [Pyrinomonadaceae bacterium]|nr:lyase family protein [Pyrinomonadaceae bacterium]
MSGEKRLWGGRFSGATDAGFAAFNRSYGFDRRLLASDVRGSLAHAEGLREAGVLTEDEARRISDGLREILRRASADEAYTDDESAEDVHSFIEARLIELVGDAGRRLHTGRRRNDQVATAIRLWLRDEIDAALASLRGVR